MMAQSAGKSALLPAEQQALDDKRNAAQKALNEANWTAAMVKYPG